MYDENLDDEDLALDYQRQQKAMLKRLEHDRKSAEREARARWLQQQSELRMVEDSFTQQKYIDAFEFVD